MAFEPDEIQKELEASVQRTTSRFEAKQQGITGIPKPTVVQVSETVFEPGKFKKEPQRKPFSDAASDFVLQDEEFPPGEGGGIVGEDLIAEFTDIVILNMDDTNDFEQDAGPPETGTDGSVTRLTIEVFPGPSVPTVFTVRVEIDGTPILFGGSDTVAWTGGFVDILADLGQTYLASSDIVFIIHLEGNHLVASGSYDILLYGTP